MNWLTLKFKNHWKLSSATKNALWNFWEKGYDNDKLDYDEESSDDECNNGDHRPFFDHHQNDNNKGDKNNQKERSDHSNRPKKLWCQMTSHTNPCANDVVNFRTWPGISLETSMISTVDLDGVTCLTGLRKKYRLSLKNDMPLRDKQVIWEEDEEWGLGATTSKEDTLYRENSTLVGSDMQNLKGKMVTRQSLRKINSTKPQRKGAKNVQRHRFVGISKANTSITLRRATDALDHSYSICCSRGKVKLGTELKEPPKLLKDLITNEHNKSAAFIDNIRHYNSMFAFTSMGGKVDDMVNYGRGLFCYRIHDENYHRVGSLLPGTDKTPKFAQLYIFDTENEITNRIKAVSKESCTSSKDKKLDHQLATEIRDMLDSINPLVQKFHMAGERIKSSNDQRLKLRLIGTRNQDGRQYNLPTASEVVALIVGDFDSTKNKRDIILLQQDGDLKRITERNLKSEDRPDVKTRVFKMKLDSLIKDLKERHIFGRAKGVVYTIEFQKRGLPYCHILLWLEPEDKITTTAKIDKYISAKIPNKNEDPELYQIVMDHKMHGPCGADNPSYPCTIDFKCNKKFPKQFNETTVIDDKGYAIYKRRNDGNTITKSRTDLHNGYVVPCNAGLLRRYQSHINVEWCNQIGSIKYLFKYINKGPDRVTAAVDGEEVDEIKDFYDCRYLSACEVAWQIYGFDIHYRTPLVERLPFNLQDEQSVIFDATKSIDYTFEKSSVNETKFAQWMELNKTDDFASTLLYVEIPKYYVWNTQKRIWDPRQRGFSLGRIHHVPLSWGELFYLRVLLHKVKGPKEWSELKKYDNVVYPTYRDACYARGLLQDDKEYIYSLLEASQ
ncbi:hypothetical protein Tco_0840516 [Tanacetum coccineum]|uniref:Helitron helicase-like domain-containing protein n=1 Tax=Tanacetum coccineum TaxID=301880 RepID=A0ABQ5AYP8_9ASTR